MKNVYFVTFGTVNEGHKQFKKSLLRLKKEAIQTNWFKDIFIYTENELQHYNRTFEGVGAGWWWWKPTVVKEALSKVNKDDIILFLDSGFSINKNGEKRFYEYIKLCDKGPGFLGFGGGPISSLMGEGDTDEHHTKRDLIVHLECDSDKFLKTSQTGSGAFFVKKNEFGTSIINHWIELSKNEHFLNHAPSILEESPNFVVHKNDQSILSLLLKKRLPQLNNYLLDKREVSEDKNMFGYNETPFKADRLDDSKLWYNVPQIIVNGKLVRADYNYK